VDGSIRAEQLTTSSSLPQVFGSGAKRRRRVGAIRARAYL
jgi:hypothetical protein